MNTNPLTVLSLMFFLFSQTGYSQLGGLKKLAEKNTHKQETPTTSAETVAASGTAKQNSSAKTTTAAGELDFSAGSPQMSMLSVLRDIKLEEKTGRLPPGL